MNSSEFTRTQRILSAAAMTLVLSSCTSDSQARPTPPAASAESTATASPKVELHVAESTLGTSADFAASRIIQNAESPISHCKNTTNTLIDDSEWIRSGNPKAVPQLTLSYDPAHREIGIVYLFDAGPDSSPATKKTGGSVHVFFDAGPGRNIIDQKITPTPAHPNGQPMTTADVFSAISSKRAVLKSVETSDETSGVTETAFFNPDNTVSYEYRQGDIGPGPSVVNQADADKLMAMANDISNRIDRMNQAFGYK